MSTRYLKTVDYQWLTLPNGVLPSDIDMALHCRPMGAPHGPLLIAEWKSRGATMPDGQRWMLESLAARERVWVCLIQHEEDGTPYEFRQITRRGLAPPVALDGREGLQRLMNKWWDQRYKEV